MITSKGASKRKTRHKPDPPKPKNPEPQAREAGTDRAGDGVEERGLGGLNAQRARDGDGRGLDVEREAVLGWWSKSGQKGSVAG